VCGVAGFIGPKSEEQLPRRVGDHRQSPRALPQCFRCRSSWRSRWRHPLRCPGSERCLRFSSGRAEAGPPADFQRGGRSEPLGTTQRMSAELRRIEPDACNLFLNEARILTRREAGAITTPCEQELTGLATRMPKVVVDGHARLDRQLEPHRPAGLLLPDRRAIHGVAARSHVIEAYCDDGTAPHAWRLEDGKTCMVD